MEAPFRAKIGSITTRFIGTIDESYLTTLYQPFRKLSDPHVIGQPQWLPWKRQGIKEFPGFNQHS